MPVAKANNIDLWYETFGSKENTPLLLIMGACTQGILWPDEFCMELAKTGFFVIRYDHRDTGLSTCFNFETHPYNLYDMMLDAVGLLDFLQIKDVHVLGLSLGGVIAELLAVNYSKRVLSCTLIASSCDFRPMNLAYAGLPPEENTLSRTKDVYLQWIEKFTSQPPQTFEDDLEFRLEGWRILNGSKISFEESTYRKIHNEFIKRIKNRESLTNHLFVCRNSEATIKNIPQEVRVPCLVLHGTEDPIFPPDHGQALADKIKNSRYHLIDGFGHVPNGYFYDFIIESVYNLAFKNR